jgi:hypothetical protein
MMQANIGFSSPLPALDVLYFNAVLLYLEQLEAFAYGQPL